MAVTHDSAVAPTPITARVAGYLRLGKARIYHHTYGWLLALLLLRIDGLVNATTVTALVLTFVMVQAIQWSGGAFDDLGGFRDGSDAANYAGRPARTRAKKPLLIGVLNERQAMVFGVSCWVVGVAAGLLAVASLGGRAPLIAVLLLIGAQIASAQYSVGLKLSYRPVGLELTIFYVISAIALYPYWLIAGRLDPEILLLSALFGLWFLMVVSYGNASDRAGDAAVARRTLAVLLPPGWFTLVLVSLFVASITLLTLLFTTTRLNPLLGLAGVPVVVLHAVQLYYGAVRRDWRRARFLGLCSLDVGCLGLVVALALAA